MQILLRRMLMAIPALLLLSLAVFLLLELTPGDATASALDASATAQQEAHLREALGLNKPVLERYALYIGGVLRGDLGVSAKTGQPVLEELLLRLPYTLVLVGAAIVVGTALGVLLGALAAVYRGTAVDWLVNVIVSIGTALPTFWLALLFVNFFAVQLRLLPVFGTGTWQHLVLPGLCAALTIVPGITRLTRTSLLEALDSSYTIFARAKGLRERRILGRHIGPIAAISVITYIGMQTVRLISSAAIMEILFNWPGLGGLAVRAAFDRDTMLLLGTTLVIALLTFAILFCIDLTVLYLDPRISRKAI